MVAPPAGRGRRPEGPIEAGRVQLPELLEGALVDGEYLAAVAETKRAHPVGRRRRQGGQVVGEHDQLLDRLEPMLNERMEIVVVEGGGQDALEASFGCLGDASTHARGGGVCTAGIDRQVGDNTLATPGGHPKAFAAPGECGGSSHGSREVSAGSATVTAPEPGRIDMPSPRHLRRNRWFMP